MHTTFFSMRYPIIRVKISTNSREQVDLCDKSSFSVYLDKVFYKVEYLRPEKILVIFIC